MKKLLGTLVCTATLIAGASYAEAKTWSYSLDGVSVSTDGGLGTYNGTNLTWTGTKYSQDFTFLDPAAPTGTFQTGEYFEKQDILSNSVTENANIDSSFYNTERYVASLTFNYKISNGDDTALVWNNASYTVPVYVYYDSALDVEFLYYKADSATTSGLAPKTSSDGTNQVYSPSAGVSFFTNNVGAVELDFDGDGVNDGSGWGITSDLAAINIFNLTGTFTVTNTTDGPAPTPEPATMLLMGLGLAGLGVVARRRNRK